MGPDDDLPTLLASNDHLNVLRSIRVHQLREPALVVKHGKLLLGGPKLTQTLSDESARLAALEQICMAALDLQDHDLAETALSKLRDKIGKEQIRFRLLLARCLEAADDPEEALAIYKSILTSHPANLVALKRLYCLAATPEERMVALNAYLQQNMADSGGWYEMSLLRKSMGDFKGAAYALEEVVLACPLDAMIHVQLAECYATVGGLENLTLARKHMAQALELDSTNRRAMMGLVTVSNAFLQEAAAQSKKNSVEEHTIAVAQELVKYGANKTTAAYKGTKELVTVQNFLSTYTTGL